MHLSKTLVAIFSLSLLSLLCALGCPFPEAQCLAAPMCNEGDEQVESPTDCLQDDAVCYEVSICGQTIWCTGADDNEGDCRAIPTCDEGHTEVENQSGCLQDDAVCYERTVCGQTIWCTGEG